MSIETIFKIQRFVTVFEKCLHFTVGLMVDY